MSSFVPRSTSAEEWAALVASLPIEEQREVQSDMLLHGKSYIQRNEGEAHRVDPRYLVPLDDLLDHIQTPIPRQRHRGAPAEIGDDNALQAQGTEVDAQRLPSVQAP